MLLIYSESVTPRLAYVCEFIFSRVLPAKYKLSAGIEEAESHPRVINYSTQSIPGSYQVVPSGLLSQTGIKPQPLPAKGEEPFLLFAQTAGDLSFDIFSAVFYLVSRYEEWLPFEKDRHGRFDAMQSVLYKHGVLQQPVIDQWCYAWKETLQQKFPGLIFVKRNFRLLSTIDVDNTYAYRGKTRFRAWGANVKDLVRGNTTHVRQRLRVRFNKAADPFDAYAEQAALSRQYHIPLTWFFLCITHKTPYDIALESWHPLFRSLIRHLRHSAEIGIHPSYFSGEHGKMEHEKNTLEKLAGATIRKSRQHFLRFSIRDTPRRLMKMGIHEDHSMGYASMPGFRAGTCTPFKYFDLEANAATSLEMVPFCVMDSLFYDYLKLPVQEAGKIMQSLIEAAKAVDGQAVMVWHDRSFSELHYPGWKALYQQLHVTFAGS